LACDIKLAIRVGIIESTKTYNITVLGIGVVRDVEVEVLQDEVTVSLLACVVVANESTDRQIIYDVE
jgi:hypothetical protein